MKKLFYGSVIVFLFLCFTVLPIQAQSQSATKEIGDTYAFTWDRNHSNDLVTHYQIYRDSVPFDTFQDSSCIDGNCETSPYTADALGIFTFTITAVDQDGLESDISDCILTLTVQNTLPPDPVGGCAFK